MKQITDRELAMILFALRYVQDNYDDLAVHILSAEHFEELKPLKADEIDTLCQSLNTEPFQGALNDFNRAG
jgi:hypothetical protein